MAVFKYRDPETGLFVAHPLKGPVGATGPKGPGRTGRGVRRNPRSGAHRPRLDVVQTSDPEGAQHEQAEQRDRASGRAASHQR